MNISDIQTSWVLQSVLMGLQRCGVLSYMHGVGCPVTVDDIISSVTVVDKRSLEESLVFISVVFPELIKMDGARTFYISDLYDLDAFQNLLHFSLAYKPVMDNLDELLKGDINYGQGIVRDSQALSISSEHYTTAVFGELSRLVKRESGDAIVDVGCGSGHLVRRLAANLTIDGFGIDEQRPENATGYCFIKNDIGCPEKWADKLPKGKLVFVAAYVWHEFLYDSTEDLCMVWSKYKKLFPGSVMYMVEYDGKTREDLVSLSPYQRNPTAVYQLMHPLTKQGYPQGRKEWQEVIKKCNLALAEEYATGVQSTIYRIQL